MNRGRGNRGRAALAAALAVPLLAISLGACGSTGITGPALQASISGTFARLYALQQVEQGNPRPDVARLRSHATCEKGTPQTPQTGAGGWLCQIRYLAGGPGYQVTARYTVTVQTDGCYAADGDGPTSVNGSPTITGPHYQQVNNPLWLIDACFDTT